MKYTNTTLLWWDGEALLILLPLLLLLLLLVQDGVSAVWWRLESETTAIKDKLLFFSLLHVKVKGYTLVGSPVRSLVKGRRTRVDLPLHLTRVSLAHRSPSLSVHLYEWLEWNVFTCHFTLAISLTDDSVTNEIVFHRDQPVPSSITPLYLIIN